MSAGPSIEPEPAHDGPRPAPLHDVPAHVAVAPHDGVDHRGEGDPVGAQAVRVDVDLILPHQSTHARHLGDSWHRVELVADVPVLEGAQVAEGMALPLHGVPEDVPDPGRVGAEGRHHPRRQRLRHEVQPLEDTRAREVEVGRVLEDHVDHREAEGRRRADHPHPGQPLQAHRQRIRDLVLDLLGGPPRPVREHDHLVVGEIRDRVDRRGQERPVAPAAEQQEEGDHQQAVPERGLDQPVDHGRVASRAQSGPAADAPVGRVRTAHIGMSGHQATGRMARPSSQWEARPDQSRGHSRAQAG